MNALEIQNHSGPFGICPNEMSKRLNITSFCFRIDEAEIVIPFFELVSLNEPFLDEISLLGSIFWNISISYPICFDKLN